MIPLAIYLSHLQPNLLAGFRDFRLEEAIYIGYGADSTRWTQKQNDELFRDVNDTYRWILYPETIPGTPIPHTWTWLETETTIDITEGTDTYTFPADYGSFVGRSMRWPENTGFSAVTKTSWDSINKKKQFGLNSGRPYLFATDWQTQVAGSSQRQKVIFYPNPDDDYTLTYRYAILCGPLSETNPYPAGGPRISQLMMEGSRAVGEMKKNGARGDQWQVFMGMLQSAIAMDSGTNTQPTVGMLRGGGDGYYYPFQTTGRGTYYFGPSEAYGSSLYEAEVV